MSIQSLAAPSNPMDNASTAGSGFAILGLTYPLVQALVEEGYTQPTPIQARTIPVALDGRDLLGCAQTGTGKTAAFVLPILQTLAAKKNAPHSGIRALILCPTRELASQIAERTRAYGKHLGLRCAVIYGGVSQRPQEADLRRGCDILIATPGRLLDLMQQRVLSLSTIETLVLDEADRMLDMGFINDVRRIVAKVPRQRQTLLFSATVSSEIRRLANDLLTNPSTISTTPEITTAATVTHAVWHVLPGEKNGIVINLLATDPTKRRAIIFTGTKHRANRVGEQLQRAGLAANVIHGGKSQNARERALDAFRDGTVRVLVATDIAARGIDVSDVGLVVNYDLPNVAESYVHRIGRSGRAGNSGTAVSLCEPRDLSLLSDIEKLLKFRIPVASASNSNGDPLGISVAPPAAVPQPFRLPGDSARRRRPRFRR